MYFNIALLAFGLIFVQLDKASVETFKRGIVQDGVLQVNEKELEVTIETGKKAKFGDPSSANLNLLPNPLKAWAQVDVSGDLTPGESQYYIDGFYDFQAAILFAYNKRDIKPSYWYLKDCSPKKLSGDTDVFDKEGKVSNWEYISFIRGVNDAEVCYGPDSNGTCQYTCPLDRSKSPFQNSYGKGILIKGSTSQYTETELKVRIANFGPVLVYANGATEGRLYYGWEGDNLLYLYRNANGVIVKSAIAGISSVNKAYVAYQAFDCDTKLDKKTKRIDCECPPQEDAIAYKADTRTAKKNFCTASGATRAAWTVIATVLLLPLLSMW